MVEQISVRCDVHVSMFGIELVHCYLDHKMGIDMNQTIIIEHVRKFSLPEGGLDPMDGGTKYV